MISIFNFQKKQAKEARLAEKRFVSPVCDDQMAVILKGVFAKEYHMSISPKYLTASNPIAITGCIKIQYALVIMSC